jgi:hypothetical protein
MDSCDTEFMLLKAMEEEDDMLAEDDLYTKQIFATAALLVLAESSHQARIDRRNEKRNYLCRAQLLPNPRVGTPWQALFHSQNDRAYITTMGFNVETFNYIVTSGFGSRWLSQPIARSDARASGNSRPTGRSLNAWGALGLVLHYLNSTMTEISLQQIFGLIPTTVSRYIRFGLKILLETLREIPEGKIKWPRIRADFQRCSDLIVARHPLLVGAFASIDGLNLPVQTSDDPEIENATYNGWLSEHFISSVIVFSPTGMSTSIF